MNLLSINVNQNSWRASLQFDNFGLLALQKIHIRNIKEFQGEIRPGAFFNSESTLEEIFIESGEIHGNGYIWDHALSNLQKLKAVRLGNYEF